MTAGANHSNSNGCFSNHKLKMMKGWIVHLAIKSHDKNSPEKQSEQGKQRLMKSKEQVQIEESGGSGHSWERGMHACQPHVSAKIMKSHGVTWCFFKHCIACALAPSSTWHPTKATTAVFWLQVLLLWIKLCLIQKQKVNPFGSWCFHMFLLCFHLKFIQQQLVVTLYLPEWTTNRSFDK